LRPEGRWPVTDAECAPVGVVGGSLLPPHRSETSRVARDVALESVHCRSLPTAGTNDERYLAGSIHWRTGRVVLTWGLPMEGRSAVLFCRHLDPLRRAFRRCLASGVPGQGVGR
jgi:hypothetical protein